MMPTQSAGHRVYGVWLNFPTITSKIISFDEDIPFDAVLDQLAASHGYGTLLFAIKGFNPVGTMCIRSKVNQPARLK